MSTIIPPGALKGNPAREQERLAREEALKIQFPKGSYVRMLPGQAESFQASEASKLKDRVGVIRSHQPYSGSPIVDFLPVGRMKLFTKVFSSPKNYLEILTDEAEIEQWRAAFADAAAKAATKKMKPNPFNKA